jgi:hypothetical protein
VNIYETIGVSYILVATILFTAQLFYFAVRELSHIQRLIARDSEGTASEPRRSEGIKRGLAGVP